jgi:hypothetical protein
MVYGMVMVYVVHVNERYVRRNSWTLLPIQERSRIRRGVYNATSTLIVGRRQTLANLFPYGTDTVAAGMCQDRRHKSSEILSKSSVAPATLLSFAQPWTTSSASTLPISTDVGEKHGKPSSRLSVTTLRRVERRKTERLRAVRGMRMVVVAFFACWLPAHCMLLHVGFDHDWHSAGGGEEDQRDEKRRHGGAGILNGTEWSMSCEGRHVDHMRKDRIIHDAVGHLDWYHKILHDIGVQVKTKYPH